MRVVTSVAVLGVLSIAIPTVGHACTGLTCQQVTCSPVGVTTSVSGYVFAPNGLNPLPNVLVYVPGDPLPLTPLPAGVSNGPVTATNSPLVSTTTAVDGSFTLTNMPSGTNIPLVIQSGKWRRLFNIPFVPSCANTALPASDPGQIRFPRTAFEGDIPKIAVVTGNVDGLECVLRKIGIADTEFTDPSGNGRVNFFLGVGAGGAMISANTPPETTLESSATTLNAYDMVMFPCQGVDFTEPPSLQQNLIAYANAGGRVFATHYSYGWLYNVSSFNSVVQWAINQSPPQPDPQTASINTSFTRGNQLALWLTKVGASTTLGQIPLGTLRHDFNAVVPPTLLWLQLSSGTPMQFTFDTPVGAPAAQQVGRVLFNDYHVEDLTNNPSGGEIFPVECSSGPMTPQEKLLEFAIFDLSTFVAPEFPTVTVGFTNTPSSFKQGDGSDTISIQVTNTSNTTAADSSLSLTATLPTGLSLVSMAGTNQTTGWSCTGLTCTRTGPLTPGTSDPITLSVTVALTAPSQVTISAAASGGGLATNMTGQDQITVLQLQSQTINFGALSNQPFGTPPFAVTATATSGLPVSFASLTSSVCTVSGSNVTLVSVGKCTIEASQGGNANYLAAASVDQSFQVTQASQTITFGPLSNQLYGAPPFAVSATATSGLPVSFTSLTSSVCIISGNIVTLIAVGICTIQAMQAGNTIYTAATSVSQTFHVTVTASVPPSGNACNGSYNGTFVGNLNVSAGQVCILTGGVTGNITQTGGQLMLSGASVGNDVQIHGGSFSFSPLTSIHGNLQIQGLSASTMQNAVCGVTVNGNLTYQNNAAPVEIGGADPGYPGNKIGNDLQVGSNTAAVAIYGNSVGDNLQVQSDTGATMVFNNSVRNDLQCGGNTGITGGGNTAASKQGQCASF